MNPLLIFFCVSISFVFMPSVTASQLDDLMPQKTLRQSLRALRLGPGVQASEHVGEVDAAISAVDGAVEAASTLLRVGAALGNSTTSTPWPTPPLVTVAPPTSTMPLPTTTTTTLAAAVEASASAAEAAEAAEDPEEAFGAAIKRSSGSPPSPEAAKAAAVDPVAVAAASAAAASASEDEPLSRIERAMHAAAIVTDRRREIAAEQEPHLDPRRGSEFIVASQVANTPENAGCPECEMTEDFRCSGYVRFGYMPRWGAWYKVGDYHGDLQCTSEFMRGFGMDDPWPGHGKVCQCMKRTGGICGATPLFEGLYFPILLISAVFLFYFGLEIVGHYKPENKFMMTLDRASSSTYVAPMICSMFLVSFKIPDALVADTGTFSSIKHRECTMIAILYAMQVWFNVYKEWDHVGQLADRVSGQLAHDNGGMLEPRGDNPHHAQKVKKETFLFEPNGWAAFRLLTNVMMYGFIFLMMLRVFLQNETETNSELVRSIADTNQTGFEIAMRLGVFHFLTFIAWEIVQLSGWVYSSAILNLAALSLTHTPMLVVLCVVHQAAQFAGGETQPEWVTRAMWLGFFGAFGQWAGSFVLPAVFDYEVGLTKRQNIDMLIRAPKAAAYFIRLFRWQCIAVTYMGVYYLMKSLSTLPSSPECSVLGTDVQKLIFDLIAVYYFGFFVAWLVRATKQIINLDNPFGQDGALPLWQMIVVVAAIYFSADIAYMFGADKETVIVGATTTAWATVFTAVDHGVLRASGEPFMRMAGVSHIYECGRFVEWIPTAVCVILAYFLVNYH